jgi:hypothetical protein
MELWILIFISKISSLKKKCKKKQVKLFGGGEKCIQMLVRKLEGKKTLTRII